MMRSLSAFCLVLSLTGCGTGLLSSSSEYKLDLSWTASCNAVFSSNTVGCLTAQGSGYIGGGGIVNLSLASGKTPNPATITLDEYSYANVPINISGISCQDNQAGAVVDHLTATLKVGGTDTTKASIPVACLKASRP